MSQSKLIFFHLVLFLSFLRCLFKINFKLFMRSTYFIDHQKIDTNCKLIKLKLHLIQKYHLWSVRRASEALTLVILA